MIKNKKDYQQYYKVLRGIINKNDPVNLISMAPEDEYDIEVGKIMADTYRLDSLKEIENTIFNIFVFYFGDDAILAKDIYHKIAKEWLEYKNNRKLSVK